MPIQHVIAFTKHAAEGTHDAAVAGGLLNGPDAASAARRTGAAACAAYTYALLGGGPVLDEPTSTLDGTARLLSELATEAAWAAKAVAQALEHGDRVVAKTAVSDAWKSAEAALTAAKTAEACLIDPCSDLGREAAAHRAMQEAATHAVRRFHRVSD